MGNENQCPLCDSPANIEGLANRDVFLITCSRCGKFEISGSAKATFPNTPEIKEKRYLLSGQTRTHPELSGNTIMITTDNYKSLIQTAPKSISEKIFFLLKYLVERSDYPGEEITIDSSDDYPICSCKNKDEFDFFISHFVESGLIDDSRSTMGNYTAFLTAQGWDEYDRLKSAPIDSNQVFLAMKFPKEDSTDDIDRQLLEAYEKGFMPGIEDTGHDCLKIDEKEHNRKICEEILYEIKQSKFLVADVTKQRGGVYFEAGYAMSFGMEVIWTCHESDTDNIHFDARQYNRISWKDSEDLRDQLKNRIFGSVGRGKNEVKPD